MSKLKVALEQFPDAKGAVVVLSGGMDSTIAARLAVEKYGSDNVHAVSFYYKQKQSVELDLAKKNAEKLNIKHQFIDIGFLGDMVRGVSANIVGGLSMPTIKDILGDPAPATEVPFRNGILLMISCAYAQVNNLGVVVTGLQSSDQYNYFDTTPHFVDAMNSVVTQNRIHDIKIHAPFITSTKSEEILILKELDGNIGLLSNTLTCYNPVVIDDKIISCGKCPSCSERLANFVQAGIPEPVQYERSIPWDSLIKG